MQTLNTPIASKTARPSALSHGSSMRQEAYHKIEDLLNEGVLWPGMMVTQRQLVEMTGATLGSIREAVPKFEAEGLLLTVPKRGLMVPSLDVAFVREAYQMRHMIELAAVPEVIERIDRKSIESMLQWHREALEKLESNPSESERVQLTETLQKYDWQMHQEFVGAMHNTLISNAYRVTAIKIRMAVQSRLQVTSNNAFRVIREHIAVLEPLREKNIGEAQGALSKHINNSLRLALGEALE